jgi:subtilase family serine protease
MRTKTHIALGVATVFGLFLASSTASVAQARHGALPTHHVIEAVANGQARFVSLLPAKQRITLGIMLKLRNEAAINDLLAELYDPPSASYRQFLTVKQFTDRFGPAEQDYKAVIQFAKANGMTVSAISPNRLVAFVTGTVADIDRAFHVSLSIYRDPIANRTFFAPDREPTADLNVALWHIGGLSNYSIPHPLYKKAAGMVHGNTTGSGPGGDFLGSDRRAAYYGGTSLTGSGQSIGLFELDGYNLSDVQAYFRNVAQPLNVPVNNVLLLGAGGGSDGDDVEQTIDIIEAISMAPALSQVRVYIAPVSGFSSGVGDTAIFNRMATDNAARQLSVSWAWKPDDPGSDDPIFKELAAQGQSLFIASGDAGSYVTGDFVYPAEDAFVTAVGGTDLTTNGAGGSWASETGWAGSGGGPSPDGIGIPAYQQISGVINGSNKASSTLRNVPDVSAEANTDNYYCANGVCGEGLGGTSLAAPTWAGFMALVNQEAAANGQESVGFLNPPIYDQIATGGSYHSDLHDVTSGSDGAYSGVSGYDLVTGWGSPATANLINTLALGTGQCGYAGPGRVLAAGETLNSCDGRFSLVMQSTDGNLVLYWNGHSYLWAAFTQGNPGADAVMQDDGNFVVYSRQGRALWNSVTFGNPGSYLAVQNDGNLVVYNPGRVPLWNSKTCCH